jgi:D-glycero-D-manno-heptose 1,7-bisphosphate phosphatase
VTESQQECAAVFVDRDGTINREVNYLSSPEQLELLPGTVEGLRRLRAAGFKLVVVTNQAGVARGYFGEDDVHCIHRRLEEMLATGGAGVDAFYYCPHHPDGKGDYRKLCPNRKPGTGMFQRAAADLGIDLAHSFIVGDNVTDLIPGGPLGCRTVLVRTGYGQSMLDKGALSGLSVSHVAADLLGAANWIVAQRNGMCDA